MIDPQYTAVPLYGPIVAPQIKFCPDCGMLLEYWRTGRGNQYVCTICHKVMK